MIFFTFFFCLVFSSILTPLIKNIAVKLGVIDRPNYRKIHQNLTPRLGGIAIFISFMIGFVATLPSSPLILPILTGAIIIVLVGILDDIFELKARWKLLGQTLATCIVILGGVYIEFINLPFGHTLQLGVFGVPLTFFWIIFITNAINLIDGLDGLAAGVSSIVLTTISIIAFMDGNIFIGALSLLLSGSTLGFLVHNFHPAKIFMGDTGSLFLGYMISVISILGFKSITLFTLLVPIVILGVPLSDSIFAIVRRLVNKKPLAEPDKSHMHHCLLYLGFSHQRTVLLLYGLSTFFAICALLLTKSSLLGSLVITIIVIITIELIVETIGLIHERYQPILNILRRITSLKKYP